LSSNHDKHPKVSAEMTSVIMLEHTVHSISNIQLSMQYGPSASLNMGVWSPVSHVASFRKARDGPKYRSSRKIQRSGNPTHRWKCTLNIKIFIIIHYQSSNYSNKNNATILTSNIKFPVLMTRKVVVTHAVQQN